LKNLIADQELDFRRLKNGIQPRRAHTQANKERNTKIINAQKSLIEKRYYFVYIILCMYICIYIYIIKFSVMH